MRDPELAYLYNQEQVRGTNCLAGSETHRHTSADYNVQLVWPQSMRTWLPSGTSTSPYTPSGKRDLTNYQGGKSELALFVYGASPGHDCSWSDTGDLKSMQNILKSSESRFVQPCSWCEPRSENLTAFKNWESLQHHLDVYPSRDDRSWKIGLWDEWSSSARQPIQSL